MENGYENLHTHTTTSDGELSYKEVLDLCSENNISVVAFTDHDVLPDKESLKILQRNRIHQTKWVIGIEISSGWPREIGGAASNFHIVGLFVDPDNNALKKHCTKAMKGRMERMRRMVKNLQSLGFNINENDCLKESKGRIIGRSHIVKALLKNKGNVEIIKKVKKSMAEKAEHDPLIKNEYDAMISKGEKQYPYSLFLSKHAFIPDVYTDYLYWKNMDQSVELIRNAGGIAVLAHWTFSKNTVDQRMIASFFREKRLDGAEIVFSLDSRQNIRNKEIERDMQIMEKITGECGALQSGGGDSHTKQDFERFAGSELAQKTIGMIQKMRKQKKLNLEFSSLTWI